MIFGDHVEAPATAEAAQWIERSRRGAAWTVGGLVPARHHVVLRVEAPPPGPDEGGWWSAYRDVVAAIAEVGARHTSSPERAWFAVWEGHGFTGGQSFVTWREPLDAAARQALEDEQARLRLEDERRHAAVRAGLREVPRFTLPHRTYHLLSGPVRAATELREPGQPDAWRRPDLWWPDDRRWFVATDVDLWSLYVAGDEGYVAEVARSVPTPAAVVPFDHRLEPED